MTEPIPAQKIIVNTVKPSIIESYKDISRYVVLNANNISDVKDILQNIYLEVYKNIDKVSDKNYVFGRAKNVLKKYYRFKFLRKDDTEITDTNVGWSANKINNELKVKANQSDFESSINEINTKVVVGNQY